MKAWHYRPAIKDDRIVDMPMTVKVDWKLGDDGADKTDTKPADESKP